MERGAAGRSRRGGGMTRSDRTLNTTEPDFANGRRDGGTIALGEVARTARRLGGPIRERFGGWSRSLV